MATSAVPLTALPVLKSVSPREATLARFFRVLGDPTRLRIIDLLSEREHTVGDLVAALGALQPRVSAHLACLRHCGFVEGERRGREVVYRLQLKHLQDLMSLAVEAAAPEAERLATCERIGPDWV
jgi:DNA-binding transcriptional ArsR family regulator